MPPKKKKSAKKKKGKKSGKKSARSAPPTAMGSISEMSKNFFMIQIRDLENRLGKIQHRCDELEVGNIRYTKEFDTQGVEMKDVIDFLKRSLEQKSDEIADLNDRLIGLQQLKDTEQEEYEKQLQQLNTEYEETKEQLKADNMNLGGKVASLEEFRVQKEDLLAKFASMEAELARQKQENKDTIYNLEREAVVEKDRLKKEMVVRVNDVAAEFRKVSNKQMAETTKRTLRENVAINSQLAKMSDKTLSLIQENDEVKLKEKKHRQQIEMLEANEKEFKKKNMSNLKVIRMLTEKCKTQEAMLAESEANEEMYMDIKSEADLIAHQLESTRYEVTSLAKENEHLENDLQGLKKQLRGTTRNMKKLQKILEDTAKALKLALTKSPDAWGDEDHRPDLNEIEKRDNMLEHLLVLLNSAAALGVGVDAGHIGRGETERSHSASDIQERPKGFRRADSLPLSPIPTTRPNLASYQLGDLGLVPKPKQNISNVHKLKELSATTRLGGLKKVLTRSVGVQTASAPKAMFYADQLLSTASPETKSAMLRELKTASSSRSSSGKLASLPPPKKLTAKIY